MLSGQKIQLFETRRMNKDGRALDVQLSTTRELRKYLDYLEDWVQERTAELAKINATKLEQEIDERIRAEETLGKLFFHYLINLTFFNCLTKEIVSDR